MISRIVPKPQCLPLMMIQILDTASIFNLGQHIPATISGLAAEAGDMVLKTSSSVLKCRKATMKLNSVAPTLQP